MGKKRKIYPLSYVATSMNEMSNATNQIKSSEISPIKWGKYIINKKQIIPIEPRQAKNDQITEGVQSYILFREAIVIANGWKKNDMRKYAAYLKYLRHKLQG